MRAAREFARRTGAVGPRQPTVPTRLPQPPDRVLRRAAVLGQVGVEPLLVRVRGVGADAPGRKAAGDEEDGGAAAPAGRPGRRAVPA